MYSLIPTLNKIHVLFAMVLTIPIPLIYSEYYCHLLCTMGLPTRWLLEHNFTKTFLLMTEIQNALPISKSVPLILSEWSVYEHITFQT